MSDLRVRLDDEARRVAAEAGALASVLGRVERRRTMRRAATTVLALAIAGGAFGLAYAAFPGDGTRPAGAPTAGPTPTPGPTPTGDDPTPAPIQVQLDVATLTPGVVPYVDALLSSEGRGPGHGGYTVRATRETEGSEVTVIFYEPSFRRDAERLEHMFFPGADIRAVGPTPDPPLRIVVGADFAEREEEHVEAMRVATAFMWARVREDSTRAEARLSESAAVLYREGAGGLDLYAYARRAVFEVTGLFRQGPTTRVIVRIRQPREDGPYREAYEQLVIGDEFGDGRQEVLFAERNA